MRASTAGTRWGPCHGPLELRDLSLLLGHLALLRLRWCGPLPENHLQLMGAKHQTSGLVLPTWQSYWGAIPRNTVNIYIYTKYIYICMFVAYDGLLMLPQGTSTTKGYSRMITLLPEAMEKSGFLRGGKKPKGGAEWGWYLCVKHDEIMWKYVCVKLCKRLWNQMKRKQEVHAIVHVFCETWDVFRHLAPRKPMIGGFWCCWSLKSWTMRYGRVFRKPTGQARRGPQIKKKKRFHGASIYPWLG